MTSKLANPMPYVGQGCTICIGSDAYPATIVSINWSGKKIGVRHCLYKWSEERQDYDYSENYGARVEPWSLRKDGKYRPKGSQANSGYRLSLVDRHFYNDPSF